MKVTINIELEGHPKKVNQDFTDWYRGMRADMERLTVSGHIPDALINLQGGDQPSKHEPKKAPEAAQDKDQDVASSCDWKDEFAAELRKAWGTATASNQYVPPKYLRDEPKSDAERQHAAAQKLDAVKVDPFRPLSVKSADGARFNSHMVREFNHLLDRRRLEFRETLLRVFSDTTVEEMDEVLRQFDFSTPYFTVVNEVLRRRRGEA